MQQQLFNRLKTLVLYLLVVPVVSLMLSLLLVMLFFWISGDVYTAVARQFL